MAKIPVKIKASKKTTSQATGAFVGKMDLHELAIDKIFEVIISTAIEGEASAVHLEEQNGHSRVRFRKYKQLLPAFTFDAQRFKELLVYFKTLFELAGNTRLPQVGRMNYVFAGETIYLTCSLIRVDQLDRVVITVNREFKADVNALGLNSYNIARLNKILATDFKTLVVAARNVHERKKVLYSMAEQVIVAGSRVISIEEFVDVHVEGVEQFQLKPEIGLDMETALRVCVGQDYDLIIVEQIRKQAELEMLLHLALSGKKVLLGVCADNLLDSLKFINGFNIDRELLFSCLDALLIEREVNKLCVCAKKRSPEKSELGLIKGELSALSEVTYGRIKELKKVETVADTAGCYRCNQTGFAGSIYLSELVTLGAKTKRLLKNNTEALRISNLVGPENFITLRQDGIIKMFEGKVDFNQVFGFEKYI